MIKELYKLETQPVTEPHKIRQAMLTAFAVATGIGWWRGVWLPPVIAGGFLAISIFWPKPIGWALTAIKMALALAIHTINLVLLTVVYFSIVTPLGFALRLTQGSDNRWRQAPTEMPTRETFLRPY